MLFHSALRKELARSFGGSFVVLITVVMTMILIRTLGLASKGSVDPQDIMLIMGYTVVGHLPTQPSSSFDDQPPFAAPPGLHDADVAALLGMPLMAVEIGRASCRERVFGRV